MEIVVHSKKTFSTKVSKEIVPFQQEFTILECDVKIIQLGSQSRKKNLTPNVVSTPPQNLRLRNPVWYC